MQNILAFTHNHGLLVLALVGVLFTLIILEFIKQKRSATRLSPTQVTQMINHSNACILDIRTPEAYAAGHIIGAISIPLKDLSERYRKLEKFKSQPIVIVCANGIESSKAATLLAPQGFQIYLLAGGLRAWNEADMPLVKD